VLGHGFRIEKVTRVRSGGRCYDAVMWPAARDVHVWYAIPDDVVAGGLTAPYEHLLSPAERQRNAGFLRPADQLEHLVRCGLLRTTLSRYLNVEPIALEFQKGPFGRPELLHSPVSSLHFSLAHTRGLVALAIAKSGDVGLDAEPLGGRTHDLNVANAYFAATEMAALAVTPAGEQQRVFLEYWTFKEAYLKATGKGLSARLDSFSIDLTDPPRLILAEGPTRDWHLAHVSISPDYVVALAVRADRAPSVSVINAVTGCQRAGRALQALKAAHRRSPT
jgi:4'-phosphopantetheinyl transferase